MKHGVETGPGLETQDWGNAEGGREGDAHSVEEGMRGPPSESPKNIHRFIR